MHPIAFVTTVRARRVNEKNLIVESIELLSTFGYPVIIGERTDSKYLIAEDVKKISQTIVLKGHELFERRKMCYVKAAEVADNIFWVESDKTWFIKNHLPSILKDFLDENRKSIVIPGQDDKSFLKYPKFQQIVENCINGIISDLIDKNGRYAYGPFLFPSYLVKFLEKIQVTQEIGWGINAFLLLAAHKEGLLIDNILLDVVVPHDVQKEEELRLFRIKQLKEYMIALEEGVKHLF